MTAPNTYHARTVIAGGGEALTTTLERLADCRPPGKTLIIHDQPNWMTRFPRHHELGQSRRGLSTRPADGFEQPDRRMRVEEFVNELVSRQITAVGKFGDDELDLLESAVQRVTRSGPHVRIACTDGAVVTCEQLVLCTGVGPEKSAAASGVKILNAPDGARLVQEEVTTALKAVEAGRDRFKGKKVVVYGGGATAAWVCEVLFEYGIAGLLWVGPRGFDGANPGGRNSEVMERTVGLRWTAEMDSVQYASQTGGPGLVVRLTNENGMRVVYRADVVVCSTGADPLQPTGIRAMLAPEIYKSLRPVVGGNGGVVAATKDRAVIVTSTPMTTKKSWRTLVAAHTFPVLEQENHVRDGIRVTRLSAETAADLVG